MPEYKYTYDADTLTLANKRADEIAEKFKAEVQHLINSGALDTCYSRGLLFGVALENVADNFLRGERNAASYRNLKRF